MKTRIISAIIMMVVLVPVLIMGGTVFKVVLTALGALALYEMIYIKDKKNKVSIQHSVVMLLF